MKAPRHVIFDWNGTLRDDAHAARAGINAILRERGMPELSHERFRDLFDCPVSRFYESLGFDMDGEDWNALSVRFFNVFFNFPHVDLFPGTRPALAALKAAGIGCSIVTSAEEKVCDALLKSHGIRGYFHSVFGLGDPTAGSKIDRGRALFRELGLAASDVCVVGDTGHDLEVAEALGCGCVLLAAGYESRARLEKRGVPLLDSIADVPAYFGLPPVDAKPLARAAGDIPWAELEAAAREAAGCAYAPYSRYPVGAALLAADGTVFTGCNVENASFGLTNCAERTALFKAVSEGRRVFRAVVVAGGSAEAPAAPCGACRQALAEFCRPETPVRVVPLSGAGGATHALSELLPCSFSMQCATSGEETAPAAPAAG